MCRFLLARSKQVIQPAQILSAFAAMCEASRGSNGDRQEDGWGIAWNENGAWTLRKSLLPIWEEPGAYAEIPPTRLWVAHARSAGFAEHKGQLSHNQPYVADSLCYVFNGMLRGVRLPMRAEGEIGAQKIFSLIRQALAGQTAEQALRWTHDTLAQHSRHIVGMNIGLVQDERFHLLCEYAEHPEYFGLNYHQDEYLTLACSEQLPGYTWQTMERNQIVVL